MTSQEEKKTIAISILPSTEEAKAIKRWNLVS